MEITDIIGKGKDFEPPFRIDTDTPLGIWLIDSNGKCVAMFPTSAEPFARHFCGNINALYDNSMLMHCGHLTEDFTCDFDKGHCDGLKSQCSYKDRLDNGKD